jgi:hypothetical protein
MKYYLGYGRIPQNLDIDSLINNLDGNVTYKRKIKEGIIYFLSLLSNLDEYPEYWMKNEYFIINDSRLSKIVGKGGVKSRTAVIKNLLISNKVVESIPYRFKEKSTGFRLTNEYISGEFINIPFSDDILNNLKKYEFADYEQYKDLIDGKYSHLAYNFKVNEFNILDDDLKLALRNLLEIANQMVVNKRKYSNVSLKSLLSYIGKNLAQLNKLVVGDTNVSVSTSNNRLYSVLSQVPRLFRRFLQVNYKDIGEVDISACQLYILACIFSTDFSISTSGGFNLKTIYPDLYKKIKDFDFINPSRQAGRTNVYLGVYIDDRNRDLLDEFSNFDFANNDFYEYNYESALKEFPLVFAEKKGYINKIEGRNSIKNNVMNYLFDEKEVNRDMNRIVYFLGWKYSVVDYIITSFLGWYSKQELAILLQRCEAFLVLENVTKSVFDKKNSVPIFTIHDCIISTKDNLEMIKASVKKEIASITGKSVGVKTKLITKRGLFDTGSINEILSKTIVDNKVKFDKATRNIRTKNIELAIDYIYKDLPEQAYKWKTLVL